MPTPNIPHVQTANTFDFWRIQTNNLINVANELRSTTYEKEAGLLYLSNTIIGTAFQVSGNARVDNTLTVGTLLATTANVTGNLTAANATITGTLRTTDAVISRNLSAGNVTISGALSLGGTNITTAIADAANTVTVSLNGSNPLSKKKINFIDSASVTFSVVAGCGDNADITLTAAGGGGGGSGAQGPQGRQGATGATGAAGSPGAQGATGATGSAGSPGAQGATGATGSAGSPGAQGATGATGSAGAQGATGPSTAINATNDTSNNPLYPVMVGTTGSNQIPKVSTPKLSFNANDGTLTAIKFSGDGTSLTGIAVSRTSGDAGTGALIYNGTTRSAGVLYGGTTNPASTTRVNYDGALYAYSLNAINDITAFVSDDRLKDKLYNIDNALSRVETLNGFYFKFNDTAKALGYEHDERMVGVSAQEVQIVMPEVIAKAPISDEYLTVQYEKLVPLLIEAIKELKKEVDDLKSRL